MTAISVIIPTYNRSRLLNRSLESVLKQTRQADELIVIDDGSTDDTSMLIQEQYPSVVFLRQPRRGASAARNSGIEKATGEWLAFLDSDDEWLPEKLERQMAAIEANPEYLFVHTNEKWMYKGKPKSQKQKHQKFGGRIFQKCLPLCVISPSSVLIHRSVLNQAGLFDEELPACEDYDLWLRISARFPVLFIDEELIIKHGGHRDQLSQKHWGMDRFRIWSIRNILESGILSENDREAAINTLLEKVRIYLKGAEKHHNDEHVIEFTELLSKYSKN